MTILFITDIHGRRIYGKRLKKMMENVDLVLIGGDITNFGDYEDVEEILFQFEGVQIFAVPGNCDRKGVNRYLDEKGISIDSRCVDVEDIKICGLGGGNKTPFSTPQEYSSEVFKKRLDNIKKEVTKKKFILVSHTPPHKTKMDKTFFGLHAGSIEVRKFIEETEPLVVFSGHIHEARGVDRLRDTILVNPGPFPAGYAKLEYPSLNIEIG